MSLTHPVFGTEVPPDWRLLSVDEIKAPEASACVAGPFGSNISSKYFVEKGVPVIRGSNLRDDLTQFVSDQFVFVSPERAKSYRAQHVRVGDLVFTCWGTIGQVGLIPDDGPFNEYIISNKQLKLRPDPRQVDSRFLFYYFASPAMIEHIRNRAIGSAVPGINLGILKSLPVVLPPLPKQRKIAAILSAYDDLIENNNRRIKLLEEMAQRIYREWFVDFRYPGHEGVPIVDSVLGPIPEGWTIGQVGDHVDVIRGRSYLGADVVDEGGIPFINLKCVARDGGFRPDGIKRYVGAFKDAHKATAGDIVMAVTDMTQERRIVARAARVPDVGEAFGVFSMDLVKIVPRDLPAAYVLGLLRYSDFPDEVKAHANGANVLHLHPDRISEYPSAFPLPAIARLYSDHLSPTQHLSDSLQAANERLRITRDLLLPRLISGAIDVTDLDIAIPQAAA